MKTIANRFPWTMRLLALTAVLMLASYRSWSQANNGPCGQTRHENIQSALLHYLPGDTVTVTGRGFAPSCDVLLPISLPDGTSENAVAATNPSGEFAFSYLLGPITGDYSILAATSDGSTSLAMTQFSSGIFVMTDKTDYKPGETVTFSGRGFQSGETVSILVHQKYEEVPDRTLSAIADGSGAFVNSDLVIDEADRNKTFWVTAHGQSSGLLAETMFADDRPSGSRKRSSPPRPQIRLRP